MNKKSMTFAVGFAVFALFLGFAIGRFVFSNSSNPPEGVSDSADHPTDEPSRWTCSMHPQIQQPGPGDCPICGMDLIPLTQDGDSRDEPRVLRMSEASRALAEIQTRAVVQDFPKIEMQLVGNLEYDQTREKSLTARFPARIEELYVNFTGIRVQAGEHLAKVYSPELLAAQRELLTAHHADPDGSITRSAREKLRLWDLLPEQIETILERGEAMDHFVLKAPIGGVVVEQKVKEGDYVTLGQPLFRIVDLSTLWAQLHAFESDLPWLRYGQDVAFTVEAFPGDTFHGTIAFIEPEVDRRTRTVPIRVNVPNVDAKLKSGMLVRADVTARLAGEGQVYAPEFAGKWISPMHPEVVKDGPGQCDVCGMDLVPAESLGFVDEARTDAPVLVPASAVLRTGKRAVVYVEQTDVERPTYEGREIVLGPRAGNVFLVADGLQVGERVVTHGAFKIDSALQIQAKPSMMNPEGSEGSASAHSHSEAQGVSAGAEQSGLVAETFELASELAVRLIEPYLVMQSALATDDLQRAKAQARAMMEITGHDGGLPTLLHGMLAADSLESFRKPHFERISNALIATVKGRPDAFEGEWIVMHCPMVYEDRGADWLQAEEPLQNPYFGAMMLKCGEVVETIPTKTQAQ